MSTIKQVVGTRTGLTFSGIATLGAGDFIRNMTAYDCTVNSPLDVVVEVDAATTNAPAGNKQVVVYLQDSLDGTNFRSGPTSGSAVTEESNLRFLGVVPLPVSGTTEVALFSIKAALNYVPQKFYVVAKNDCGVALTSATVFTAEISGTVT